MKRTCTILGLLALATAYFLGAAAEAQSDVIVFHGDTYAAIA